MIIVFEGIRIDGTVCHAKHMTKMCTIHILSVKLQSPGQSKKPGCLKNSSTSQEDVDLSHAQFILVITLNVKNDLHEDKENGN